MPLGNPHLTDRPLEWQETVPGMAHFAGTGPPDTTCRNCRHRGTVRKSVYGNDYRWYGCAKFRQLTAEWGAKISGALKSCKYFEPKVRKKLEESTESDVPQTEVPCTKTPDPFPFDV